MIRKISWVVLLLCVNGFLLKNNFAADSVGNEQRIKSFNDFFELKKEIPLSQNSGTIIGMLGDCAIDKKGNIWVADKLERNLKKYDENGRLLQIIGRKGEGPGEFALPWSLYVSEIGRTYVVDPSLSRLSIFKISGEFEASFNIKDGRQVATSSTGDIIIVAAPWRVTESSGFCIHLYNYKGEYLRSFYPISDAMLKNHMLCDNVSFDIDKEDNIYCIQETEYTIHKYNLSGQLLKTFFKRNSYYKAPPSKPFEETYSRQAIVKWSESWTHVVSIKLLNNGLLLINLLQVNPRKFIIDIYDTDGNFIVGGLTTDFRLICNDESDNIYFLQTKETSTALNYILLKFSLKGI